MTSLYVLILLYASLMVVGYYMPLHTDEINWSISNHRALHDGGQLMTLVPQCRSAEAFALGLPWLWMPAALMNHLLLFSVDGLPWLRIFGLLRFALMIGLLWLIVRRLSVIDGVRVWPVFTMTLALIGINELPLLLMVNRPEQTLLLGVMVAVAAWLYAATVIDRWQKIAMICGLIVTMLLVFPAHPKTITLLPIMLAGLCAVVWHLCGSRWITVSAGLWAAVFAYHCMLLWMQRFDCSDSQEIRRLLDRFGPQLALLFVDPLQFITITATTLFESVNLDLQPLGYITRGDEWLPYDAAGIENLTTVSVLLSYFSFSLLVLGLVVALSLTIKSSACALMYRQNPAAQEWMSGLLLAVFIALEVITGAGKIFYHVAINLTILLLAVLLNPSLRQYLARFKQFHGGILSVALANLTLLMMRYSPYMIDPQTQPANLQSPRAILISTRDDEAQQAAVIATYKQCGLPPVEHARHLVVDDYSYLPLKHSFQPLMFHYATDLFLLGAASAGYDEVYDHPRFMKLMREFKSDGVLMRCHHAPKALRASMTQHGDYCCLRP